MGHYFAVKDMPLGRTLKMMMMITNFYDFSTVSSTR